MTSSTPSTFSTRQGINEPYLFGAMPLKDQLSTYIGGGPDLTVFAFNASATDVGGLTEVHADGSIMPTVKEHPP
ncbi:hypothetical protein ACH4LQ_11160 [Streptomyces globisporus]|uniref:hypothetical protein n=1 Tax=Streptomyces globisporus TaxID=1908 RepID=UPI0037A260B9